MARKEKRIKWLLFGAFSGLIGIQPLAYAHNDAGNQDGKSQDYPKYQWRFSGPFGTYDLASVQRGYAVYRQVCSSCHTIQHMTYGDLMGMGLNAEQVQDIAEQDQVPDGQDAQGKTIYRKARLSDHFPAPYMNDAAAKAANMGHVPLDFSRLTLTVPGGADYIMAILLGYREKPAGFNFDHMNHYYNLYAKDKQIGMKPPLQANQVRYMDGTKATIEQEAKDVTTFLSWTAQPHLIERHRIGVRILFYSLFMVILAYLVKRKVWFNVRK